ncbi:hypothetical protein FYC62_03440 [Pedobacter aquae]|uniref:DUF8192 domain-containing protein n=2 Tax=Pedobacter aquae TaxID=2605747 RepID=A0A5C0VFJ6_9SPHI|nr:hypothetical protein FYC62_03440 [Pedobacter aquae]
MSQSQKSIEQNQVQNSDKKSNEMLNTEEAELLNFLLKDSRGTFDFQGKKIAFIMGSSGSRILSKADYFIQINPWLERGNNPQIFMVLLTPEQKDRSGGYDAFVLSWVKVFTDRKKDKVIDGLAVRYR